MPVLATVGVDVPPQARTFVLRHVDAELGQLKIFTDGRSPKVKELAANPQTLLMFWSMRLRWQLRVRADMRIQQAEPEVAAAWTRVS
jgi:pyridoxamine 5'-phosphate oxidase